jgi:hypothetical protein
MAAGGLDPVDAGPAGPGAAGSGPPGGPPAWPPGSLPVNRLAVAAISCAIGQLLFFFVAAIPAVILGHLARRQIRRSGEGGDGLALASLILGYIGLGLGLLAVAALIGFFIAWQHRSARFPQVPPMLGNPG